MCVDEDPAVAVPQNLPYAKMLHFKDFYIRPTAYSHYSSGWTRSLGGRNLRGAIVGDGDLDWPAIARSIRQSGYEGFASIEFEGLEDPLIGCSHSIANANQLLTQA